LEKLSLDINKEKYNDNDVIYRFRNKEQIRMQKLKIDKLKMEV
jgi:hypothetical protein